MASASALIVSTSTVAGRLAQRRHTGPPGRRVEWVGVILGRPHQNRRRRTVPRPGLDGAAPAVVDTLAQECGFIGAGRAHYPQPRRRPRDHCRPKGLNQPLVVLCEGLVYDAKVGASCAWPDGFAGGRSPRRCGPFAPFDTFLAIRSPYLVKDHARWRAVEQRDVLLPFLPWRLSCCRSALLHARSCLRAVPADSALSHDGAQLGRLARLARHGDDDLAVVLAGLGVVDLEPDVGDPACHGMNGRPSVRANLAAASPCVLYGWRRALSPIGPDSSDRRASSASGPLPVPTLASRSSGGQAARATADHSP